MNDHELEKRLKSVPVPERPETYWENFPDRVLAQLRAGERAAEREGRAAPRWRMRFAWGIGVAFACLVIGFAVGRWQGRQETDAFALMQSEKMLREVLTMFPNQVRAIVQDERGVQLVLSDKPDVPASTPLWIKIIESGRTRVVVTFSGQNLQIAEEKVEVLADAQGQVMLVGDRLFWSSADPDRASANLRIQARSLAYAL